jgi:hypothetical protein
MTDSLGEKWSTGTNQSMLRPRLFVLNDGKPIIVLVDEVCLDLADVVYM